MDRQMAESLDRWITGNYGEDQFKNAERCGICRFADSGTCSNCSEVNGVTEISEDFWCENFKEREDRYEDIS